MRAKAGIFGMKKIKGIGFGRHDFLKIHLAIRARCILRLGGQMKGSKSIS